MSIYTNVPSFKTLSRANETITATVANEEVTLVESSVGCTLSGSTVTFAPGISCTYGVGGSALMTWAFNGNMTTVTSVNFEDVLHFWPICVTKRGTYTKLGAVVSNNKSGRYMKLGLYTDSNGAPSALLADSGAIIVDTTGAKEYTMSNVTLTPGWYWVAFVADVGASDPSFRALNANTVMGICGYDPSASASQYCGYSVAHTFSNSLPNPAGSVALRAVITSPIVYIY